MILNIYVPGIITYCHLKAGVCQRIHLNISNTYNTTSTSSFPPLQRLSHFSIHTTIPLLSFRFSSSVSSCAGDLYSLLSKLLGEREDVAHMHNYSPAEAARAQTRLMAEIDSIMQKKDLGWPRLGYKTKEDAILVRDRVHKFHQLESTVSPSRSRMVPARQPTTGAAPRDQPGGFRPRFFFSNKKQGHKCIKYLYQVLCGC